MTIKTAGTYMQLSDLCSSCSKQNYCGNGTTDYYCTGYAPIVYTQINTLQGGTMLEPFDSEFLSQELRDAWKKIEELEKENKELKERNTDLTKEVMRLGKIILEQEKELKYYAENYDPYWAGENDYD